MWLKVDAGSGVPLYLQITESIQQAVDTGYLGPGEQLPSVRELAVDLIISPNTVARAYRELEREGLIVTRQGRGTFISSRVGDVSRRRRHAALRTEMEGLVSRARLLDVKLEELLAMLRECYGEDEDG